jgi:hypothetical protein
MVTTSRANHLALPVLGAAFVIAGLLLLDVVPAGSYLVVIVGVGSAAAVIGSTIARGRQGPAWLRNGADLPDLAVIIGLYVTVVAALWLAFGVFTESNTLGLFLSFGFALVLGVLGPLYYTVWLRGRPLASLGLSVGQWRSTAILAVLFAGVQFTLTLARLDYPALESWLPLLAMAVPVGLFESVFFRGFIQNRLEAAFGLVPAIAGAAALYGLYHVGYGMGVDEILFLSGLGIVYAVAFRVAGSIVVLWPLLTPLGSLFNQIQAGDIVMPMESILGFADLLVLMVGATWFARRHERRRSAEYETRRGTGAAVPHEAH